MASMMDGFEKLHLLGAGQLVADRDACTTGSCGVPQVRPPRERSLPGIYRAAVPGKGRIPLLRVLMTNVCQFDCRYCAINCHRDVQRSSYTPEELVATFMELYRRGAADARRAGGWEATTQLLREGHQTGHNESVFAISRFVRRRR